MTAFALLALVFGAYLCLRGPSRRPGPGASAAARARQLRTPRVRLATLLGVSTRGAVQAARWEAGAVGERRTALRLAVLEREGWTVLHDRALPRSRANVDHLVISPRGAVILPDSKLWSSRYRVRVVGDRLLHGNLDVTDRLNGLRHETDAVAALLCTPVIPLVVMDGAPVEGGELVYGGVRIIPAGRVVAVLRALDRASTPVSRVRLAARAARRLPPYLERSR